MTDQWNTVLLFFLFIYVSVYLNIVDPLDYYSHFPFSIIGL